jgi:hypothetical protein
VTVSVSGLVGSQRQQQQVAGASDAVRGQAQVQLKYKCGASPDVVQLLVWLYADASMAQPLEVWQVSLPARSAAANLIALLTTCRDRFQTLTMSYSACC